MPSVGLSALSVAANAKSTEQLQSTQLENTGEGGMIEYAAKASATGLNTSLIIGGVTVIDDQVVPYTGTAGTLSIRDNIMDVVQVGPGLKAQLFFRNTTGAAITCDALLRLV